MVSTIEAIRAKVTRAKQHVEDFQLRARAFYDTHPYKISAKEDAEAGKRIYYLVEVAEVPLNIASIAADALQNLRSPLDHIAYQLELTGGGSPPKHHVYFPIANSAAEYPALRRRYIKCAGQAAIDAIDATEPYKGGKGHELWQLHALNKPDKHRLLLTTGSYFEAFDITSSMRRARRADSPGLPEWAHTMLDAIPSVFFHPADRLLPLKAGDELFSEPLDLEVDQNMKFVFDISFNDPGIIEPEPALKTLQDMTNLVDSIVTAFEPLLP